MTYRTEPAVPADIITYRLDSKLVYVRPADDYEVGHTSCFTFSEAKRRVQQALDYAQKEYPELAELERSRISFHINAKLNGHSQPVRISESAWPAAVSRLLRGEVIDVCIQPSIDAKYAVAPPQYLEVPQPRYSLSAPSSPPRRSPSPALSTRSEKNKRSWFGRG
ncbi:hypothetical protein C0992_005634 [Termitomyces sp. T32_za158]|nr:hypothetical protein C0992_005634 [Termitomyces sp. T32_za158]